MSLLLPLLALACSSPDTTAPVPPPVAPPPEAAPVGEPVLPAGTPGPEGAPGPDGATPPVAFGDLAALAAGGPTTTLAITLKGASSATVDFMIEVDGQGRMIAQEKVTSATSTVNVPASYHTPVWVSAWSDVTGDGPDPSDLVSVSNEPLTLDGKPQAITLTLMKDPPPPKAGPFHLMRDKAEAAGPPGTPPGPPPETPPGPPPETPPAAPQ